MRLMAFGPLTAAVHLAAQGHAEAQALEVALVMLVADPDSGRCRHHQWKEMQAGFRMDRASWLRSPCGREGVAVVHDL